VGSCEDGNEPSDAQLLASQEGLSSIEQSADTYFITHHTIITHGNFSEIYTSPLNSRPVTVDIDKGLLSDSDDTAL
jgi:hypothetical protein